MREKLRSHLTYANVMATTAVFLVLAGGTALGAYVITSNSQVAQGTISGHRPPSGDHPNIILGSLNGQDVRDLIFQPVALKNGWVGNCAGGGFPSIARGVEAVVHLRGTLCRVSGTSLQPFDVPVGFVPDKVEYIPVDLCLGRTGRIVIDTTGQVTITDDPDLPSASGNGAACFTSLDGVSYTLPH
jgi:hypothetical protein